VLGGYAQPDDYPSPEILATSCQTKPAGKARRCEKAIVRSAPARVHLT
jgi:hypothetical protein